MGRFDKIRYWNGLSWAQPNQVRIWNGTEWTDYGTNDSGNTNSINTWNGSTWTRSTLNKVVRQTGTDYTFDNWEGFWPNASSGTFGGRSNASYFAGADYNCSIPPGADSWGTLSWDLLDWNNSNGYGYATSTLNAPNVWRDFYFRWPNKRKWIHNLVFWSCSTSLWTGCPSKMELWGGDRATYVGTYGFTNPGGKDQPFYSTASGSLDYRPNGGISSMTMVIYDGAEWKRAAYSLRMRSCHIEGGAANTIPIYTTYWE